LKRQDEQDLHDWKYFLKAEKLLFLVDTSKYTSPSFNAQGDKINDMTGIIPARHSVRRYPLSIKKRYEIVK